MNFALAMVVLPGLLWLVVLLIHGVNEDLRKHREWRRAVDEWKRECAALRSGENDRP